MENTEHETEVKNIRAYDKGVKGCQRHDKDVMLAFDSTNEEYDIKDLFLTQEQAEFLHKELGEVIARNNER
jgi:hypothetical protein